ncbi:MAG: hypothetical protein WHV66_01380 [Anaerolineales bacterium]
MSEESLKKLIEHLSSIIYEYIDGDLDDFSYDQLNKDIKFFEKIVVNYSRDEESEVVVGLVSQAISYLYPARGFATPDTPRDQEYYSNMQQVRRLLLAILNLRD